MFSFFVQGNGIKLDFVESFKIVFEVWELLKFFQFLFILFLLFIVEVTLVKRQYFFIHKLKLTAEFSFLDDSLSQLTYAVQLLCYVLGVFGKNDEVFSFSFSKWKHLVFQGKEIGSNFIVFSFDFRVFLKLEIWKNFLPSINKKIQWRKLRTLQTAPECTKRSPTVHLGTNERLFLEENFQFLKKNP